MTNNVIPLRRFGPEGLPATIRNGGMDMRPNEMATADLDDEYGDVNPLWEMAARGTDLLHRSANVAASFALGMLVMWVLL